MRIVFDCRSVFPGMGGIGRTAAALARELPGVLPEDELVLLVGSRHPDGPLATGPNVSEVPVEAAMIDPVFEQIKLPALLDELEADLYHNPCFSVPIATRVRAFATVHDVIFRRRPELVDEWLRAYLDRWTGVSCALAETVLTVSEFSRREIAALYDRQAAVIPNGIDEHFFNVERQRSRDPFILYVGALEEKKNVVPLLHGFAEFRHEAPDFKHKLVLVGGSGGARFDLDSVFAREPKLRERVEVRGYVSDTELRSLYASADAFAYLSEYEGFGLPPLEAMAAGVPTLVSDRSSLPEVTSGGALVVDPHDAREVASKLVRLVQHSKPRTELIARGREVARRYRWQESARAVARLYQQSLRPSGFKVLAGGGA